MMLRRFGSYPAVPMQFTAPRAGELRSRNWGRQPAQPSELTMTLYRTHSFRLFTALLLELALLNDLQ
jgi:hypothetical protein